jgi:hypothetical protein
VTTFFDLIKQGDIYLQAWPRQKSLYSLFIDSKIACCTRLLIKVIPALVIFSITLTISLPSAISSWPVTATFVLFCIGLPVQGLIWLGVRSQEFLPIKLFAWYMEIHSRLNALSDQQFRALARPRYLDLAHLLNNAFRLAGDKFLQKYDLI